MSTVLKRNAGKTSDVEFLIDLHKAVALGDNAHSEGRLGLFAKQFGSLPFRGYWFDSKYYIIRVDSGYESLLGGTGLPILEIMQLKKSL